MCVTPLNWENKDSMESVYITCLTNSSSSLYKNYHFHSHTTSASWAGALTDSRIHQSVLLVCQRLFVHGWLGKKEKKSLLFFVSTCLREPTRLNFVRYGRGVTSQGKIPFWCCVLEAKIIIMGLVTNYILKMSGLPALEEVCYDHTMQL